MEKWNRKKILTRLPIWSRRCLTELALFYFGERSLINCIWTVSSVSIFLNGLRTPRKSQHWLKYNSRSIELFRHREKILLPFWHCSGKLTRHITYDSNRVTIYRLWDLRGIPRAYNRHKNWRNIWEYKFWHCWEYLALEWSVFRRFLLKYFCELNFCGQIFREFIIRFFLIRIYIFNIRYPCASRGKSFGFKMLMRRLQFLSIIDEHNSSYTGILSRTRMF